MPLFKPHKLIIFGVLLMTNFSALAGELLGHINSTAFGIKASDQALHALPHINMPAQKGDKIVTLNKQGFMKVEMDNVSLAFIEHAKNSTLPVLEIGAAYGAAAIPALDHGATVIANDISDEHLAILYRRAKPTQLSQLYLNNNRFPGEMNLPAESLGAVLACRVAHFLTGDEMAEGLKKVYDWLAPGGKLYFVTLSPYHHILRETFLPIYLQRVEDGEEWPGIVPNLQELASPEEAKDLPTFLHVFDEPIIRARMQKIGFEVEQVDLLDYSSMNSDGRGYIGVVAVKPKK